MSRRLRPTTVLLVLVLVALAAGGAVGPAARAERAVQPDNVILVCWDGLDRSVFRKLLDAGRLPNLQELAQTGSVQDIDIVGHATCTKPGHAEMLTGLAAETTGVYTNRRYRAIPAGYTFFERAQDHLDGRDAIRTVMVTGKLAHVGGRTADEIKALLARQEGRARAGRAAKRRAAGADLRAGALHGEPFALTRDGLDVFDNAARPADTTGPLCLQYLQQYQRPRFLAFLHFSDPDHAGHKHGIDSEEYRQAAQDCDRWLGEIMTWLQEQDMDDRTLVYVTTDHGFDAHARSHRNAPDGWLATNDPDVGRGGILADVPATILARLGVSVDELDPPLLGVSLTQPAPHRPAVREPDRPKPQRARARFRKRFARLDADGDGVLTLEEMGRPRAFRRMDADEDGQVTRREAWTHRQERAKARAGTPEGWGDPREPQARGSARGSEGAVAHADRSA